MVVKTKLTFSAVEWGMLEEEGTGRRLAKYKLVGYYFRNKYHRFLYWLERGRLSLVAIVKTLHRWVTAFKAKRAVADAANAAKKKDNIFVRIFKAIAKFFSATKEVGAAVCSGSVELSKAAYQIAQLIVTLIISILSDPLRTAIALAVFWFVWVETHGGWDQFFKW